MATAKNWTAKLNSDKPAQVKLIDKKFADIPPNSNMLIATPKLIDTYIRQIPNGKTVSLQTLRKDLALDHKADYTCPVTTGIFLRIVAEAAHEKYQQQDSLKGITPFWRAVDPDSPLAKKLSFGKDFIVEQRVKEGIG
jgi:hypothetical protein